MREFSRKKSSTPRRSRCWDSSPIPRREACSSRRGFLHVKRIDLVGIKLGHIEDVGLKRGRPAVGGVVGPRQSPVLP